MTKAMILGEQPKRLLKIVTMLFTNMFCFTIFHHVSPCGPNPVSFPSSSPGQIHHDIFQLPKVIVDDDLPGLLSFVHEEVTIQALFSSGKSSTKKDTIQGAVKGTCWEPPEIF